MIFHLPACEAQSCPSLAPRPGRFLRALSCDTPGSRESHAPPGLLGNGVDSPAMSSVIPLTGMGPFKIVNLAWSGAKVWRWLDGQAKK